MEPVQKHFNSTVEGQMAMAYNSSARANAFIMAKFIRSKGEVPWTDAQISGASGSYLDAIKEDLLNDYNRLAAQK